MKRMKTKDIKKLKSHKYVYISLLILLLCPLNYTGKTIRIKNDLSSSSISTSRSYEKSAVFHEATQATTPSDLAIGQDTSPLDKINFSLLAVVSLISVIIISILYSIILGYLHSVVIVKQCLLSILYQDAGKLFLCAQWLWLINILLGYQTGSKEMILQQKITTKVFCFLVVVTSLHFLVTLNIICALQLFMKKELILDPPLPWGYDETAIIKRIRLTIIFFILWMAVMYGLDAYPLLYYRLIGDQTTLSELPISTQLLGGMRLLLEFSFLGASLVNEFYRRTNCFQEPGEEQSNRMPNLSLLFAIILAISLIIHASMIWGFPLLAIRLICQMLMGIIFPGYIILNTAELKKYAKKTTSEMITRFQGKLENMNRHAFNIFRHFHRNSSQIQPIV